MNASFVIAISPKACRDIAAAVAAPPVARAKDPDNTYPPLGPPFLRLRPSTYSRVSRDSVANTDGN